MSDTWLIIYTVPLNLSWSLACMQSTINPVKVENNLLLYIHEFLNEQLTKLVNTQATAPLDLNLTLVCSKLACV